MCDLSANLKCMSEMCCTRLAEKQDAKMMQKITMGTIAQLCRAISSQLTGCLHEAIEAAIGHCVVALIVPLAGCRHIDQCQLYIPYHLHTCRVTSVAPLTIIRTRSVVDTCKVNYHHVSV